MGYKNLCGVRGVVTFLARFRGFPFGICVEYLWSINRYYN